MKKILLALTVVFAFALQALADASGTCGDNATWSFNSSTSTLTISGTGSMDGYVAGTGGFHTDELVQNIKYLIVEEGITSIGQYAFASLRALETVTLPKSLKTIASSVFENCTQLTAVEIPDGVTTIGPRAFDYCTSLASVSISKTVSQLENAFSNCPSLMEITVAPANATYDSRNNCNAIIRTSSNKLLLGSGSTVIPNTVKTITGPAFRNCKTLTSIEIPSSVTTIETSAFSGCENLTSVVLPKYLTTIPEKMFYMCKSLRSVSLPEAVGSIEDAAFAFCSSLQSVELPDHLRSIGSQAFYSCDALPTIVLPAHLESVQEYAFSYSKNLKTMYVKATTPPVCADNVFKDFSVDVYVPSVPESVIDAYRNASQWKDLANLHTFDVSDFDQQATARMSCDANTDGSVNSADVVRIYNYIITGE